MQKEKAEGASGSESKEVGQEKGATAASGELEKTQEEAAKASDQKELSSEEQLQDAIKKLLDDPKSCTQEEQIVIDKFVTSLIRLIKNYGYDEVMSAVKLFKTTKARIITDKFFLENIEEVAKVLKKNANHQSAEFKEAMQLIDEFYNGAQYHADIDREALKLAIELFKNTPGAIIDDGPLKKVLKFGKAGSVDGKLAVARGAMYELEAALKLLQEDRRVMAFGIKLRGKNSKSEFDILTNDTLVECKDVAWGNLDEETNKKRKNTIIQQSIIAKEIGLYFEVYSKKKIPLEQAEWFNEFDIKYSEVKK